MEKKLQDYIHYYIGCKCLFAPYRDQPNCIEEGEITGLQLGTIYVKFDIWQSIASGDISSIKPILRNLESLTEDEMKECGNLVYDFSNDPDLNVWHWENFEAVLCAEQFDWLLKRGFDLFGLIDVGLAIDSKTLK